MRLLSVLALLAGLAVLAWLVTAVDLRGVRSALVEIGWFGAAAIALAFLAGWTVEVLGWACTFTARRFGTSWLWALWRANMVGEAMNVVMPFGALGGEPVKGVVLKRHHGVGYRESTAPLLLMQVMLALAEAAFAAIGVAIALYRELLPAALAQALGIATALLAAVMLLALLGLRQRWLQGLGRRLARHPRWGHWLDVLGGVEAELFTFARHPRRFGGAFVLFFGNWLFGALEIWVALHLLGAPLDLGACWLVEVAIVLIRTATFFIPAQIGSTEAATVLIVGVLAGSEALGFALAVVRRLRELVWTALGLLVGLDYARRG